MDAMLQVSAADTLPACGSVRDARGQPIAGAQLTAMHDGVRTARTGPDGRFCFDLLRAGDTLTVLHVGFDPLQIVVGPRTLLALELEPVGTLGPEAGGLLTKGGAPSAQPSAGEREAGSSHVAPAPDVYAGQPEEKEEGGRVYELRRAMGEGRAERRSAQDIPGAGGTPMLLCFGRGDVDFGRVHVGDRLWKTSDPELDRRLRQSFAGETPRFQRPLQMEVHGLASQPLTLIARDEQGHVVQLDSAVLLAEAHKQPMTTERLRHQLGRLGGTAFKLGELKNLLQGDVLLPMSELNRLRRGFFSLGERRGVSPPCKSL